MRKVIVILFLLLATSCARQMVRAQEKRIENCVKDGYTQTQCECWIEGRCPFVIIGNPPSEQQK